MRHEWKDLLQRGVLILRMVYLLLWIRKWWWFIFSVRVYKINLLVCFTVESAQICAKHSCFGWICNSTVDIVHLVGNT